MCIGRDPTQPASRSDSLNSTLDTNLGARVDQRVACRYPRREDSRTFKCRGYLHATRWSTRAPKLVSSVELRLSERLAGCVGSRPIHIVLDGSSWTNYPPEHVRRVPADVAHRGPYPGHWGGLYGLKLNRRWLATRIIRCHRLYFRHRSPHTGSHARPIRNHAGRVG